MAWPESVRWVYVLCHPEKEKARFERLVPHLLMRGIPKDRLRFCAPTWGDSLENDLVFKVYDPFLNRGGLPAFSFKSARLTKGEISLILNFYAAVSSAAKELSGNEVALFLEADTYLRQDFVKRLTDTLTAAEEEAGWGYISLGDGVATRPPGCPKSMYGPARVYKPPHTWAFRCTDSMLLSGDFIRNLAKTLIPFNDALDWELDFQVMLHQGKSLWADPPLAEQGTTRNREESVLK